MTSQATAPTLANSAANSDKGYTGSFFLSHQDNSLRSAQELAPVVVQMFRPKSVIDVGCGLGTWLSVFRDCGVEDILGVDNEWVKPELLLIRKEQFLKQDLEKPFCLPRQFDLVVSMEVAEHLAPECADGFVDTLVHLGPVILFSAAVPYQGGVNHVNEQWPEYWAGRFEARGYVPVDCLRPKFWTNAHVEWWYRQNAILYVQQDRLPLYALAAEPASASDLSIVHRELYLKVLHKYKAALLKSDPKNLSLRQLLAALPHAFMRAAGRRIVR